MLPDGLCALTCAMFLDLMVQQGVRTVVAGGLPEDGPMQAAAGTRGEVSYDLSQIDHDIHSASQYDESASKDLPDTHEPIWVISGSVNLRDRLRPGDDEPLQFKYMPATCRIFYTLDNYANYINLCNRAGDAIWKDSKLCVPGSTGHEYYAPRKPANTASLRIRQSSPRTKKLKRDDAPSSAVLPHHTEYSEVQFPTKRQEIGAACSHREGQRPRPNEECVPDVALCGKNGKLDFPPESRIVRLSSFRVPQPEQPEPSKLQPRAVLGCTNDNSKCLPISVPPYRVGTAGHSSNAAFAGRWKVACYCKLPGQVCGTGAEQKLGLHRVEGLQGVSDGRHVVARANLPEAGSAEN